MYRYYDDNMGNEGMEPEMENANIAYENMAHENNNDFMEPEAMENENLEAEFETLPKVIVIDQPYTDKYPLKEALKRGTLFPILKMPYYTRPDPKLGY